MRKPEANFSKSAKVSFSSSSNLASCFTSPDIKTVFTVGFITMASFEDSLISLVVLPSINKL